MICVRGWRRGGGRGGCRDREEEGAFHHLVREKALLKRIETKKKKTYHDEDENRDQNHNALQVELIPRDIHDE